MENNIKNLKIYRNVKKFVVNRVTPIVLAGAIISGVTIAQKASSKRFNYGDNSLTSISDSLSVNDDITNIDNNIRYQEEEEGKLLKELDKEFINAYNTLDKKKCNDIIAELSKIILKAQIADGYNLDYKEIKYFDIFGFRNDADATVRDEYGVLFMYKGEDYIIKSKGFAEEICYMYRAASKNQLDYNKQDILNTDLKSAYNKLKSTLTDKLVMNNHSVKSKFVTEKVSEGEKIKEQKIKYDGTFNFDGNGKLQRNAERYIKICKDKVEFISKKEINNYYNNNDNNDIENEVVVYEDKLPKKTR